MLAGKLCKCVDFLVHCIKHVRINLQVEIRWSKEADYSVHSLIGLSNVWVWFYTKFDLKSMVNPEKRMFFFFVFWHLKVIKVSFHRNIFELREENAISLSENDYEP